MARIRYRDYDFKPDAAQRIVEVNAILGQYKGALSVRQVYYRLVAAGKIPNEQREYERVQDLLTRARYAGLIDWDKIEDRNREPVKTRDWASGRAAVEEVVGAFRLDRWEGQPFYVEMWCFPPGTPVSTPGGTAPVEALRVGDRVLDCSGVPQEVRHLFRHRYEGDLIEIKACGLLPFRATPNHLVYAARFDRSRPGYRGVQRKYLEPDFIRADALQPDDLVYVPRSRVPIIDRDAVQFEGGPRTKVAPRVDVTEDFLAAVGLYVAEGCIRTDDRTLQFTFNVREVEYATIVKRWVDSIGLTWREAFGPGSRIVYVHGKAAVNFFNEFGRGSWKIHLPEWVMALPDAKLMRVIEYYFRGDGTLWDESRSALSAGTRSAELARQLQMALARCGYASSLCVVADHGEPAYRITVTGPHAERLALMWRMPLPDRKYRFSHFRSTRDYVLCPVRTVKRVVYEGEVFNIEVANTNTYCVPCVVHNCEKAALAGVISPIADAYHVVLMVNRGYSSASAMKESADRIRDRSLGERRARPVVLYVGDHDPSGEDMVRDVRDRLLEFGCPDWLDVRKVALTMDQVREYDPPPNPAKLSDARAKGYIEKHGENSWEVDALPPDALDVLLRRTVSSYVDSTKMDAVITRENLIKQRLKKMALHLEG